MSQIRTDRSAPPRRPRRRGPNWPLIFVLIGLALLAWLAAAYVMVFRPDMSRASLNARAADAIATIKDSNAPAGMAMDGEPVLATPTDAPPTLTATYRGSQPIGAGDAAVYCNLVPVPAGWQLTSCGPQPDNTLVVVFTLQ